MHMSAPLPSLTKVLLENLVPCQLHLNKAGRKKKKKVPWPLEADPDDPGQSLGKTEPFFSVALPLSELQL